MSEFFTSDFTVDELMLVEEVGFRAAGLVMGTSVYHVGFQAALWNSNQEMTSLSQATYHARQLAMQRMEQDALQHGADGVIGMRLDVSHHLWGREPVTEFVAIGTAIRALGGPSWRVNGRPFTSDLSGQDFFTLVNAGHRPLALVMGTCIYYVQRQGLGTLLGRVGRNAEMTEYTEALYDAREIAMGRMQKEAQKVGAEGIVGLHLAEGPHHGNHHILEFFAVGTAVAPHSVDHEIPSPALILPLRG